MPSPMQPLKPRACSITQVLNRQGIAIFPVQTDVSTHRLQVMLRDTTESGLLRLTSFYYNNPFNLHLLIIYMTKSPPPAKKDESKLIAQTAKILSKKRRSVEILAVTEGLGFDRYYPTHNSGILKRPAWLMYSEEVKYNGKPLHLGAYLNDLPRDSPPELVFKVKSNVFEELGFKRGDFVEKFGIFVEPLPPSKVKIYVAKTGHQIRGLTNAKWRRYEDESYAAVLTDEDIRVSKNI